MNLYPLDLVWAATAVFASICLGYQPVRLLREPYFVRLALGIGAGWLVVATLVPAEIVHYEIALAVVCWLAWRQLRAADIFRGKMWLCAASALGLALGPVLILAVTPGAWPMAGFPWLQLVFLLPLIMSGAIAGVALALYAFTRREATEVGMNALGLAKWLFSLALLRGALALLVFLGGSRMNPGPANDHSGIMLATLGVEVLLIPLLAYVVMRQCRSPRPSTAGPALLLLGGIAFAAECLALWLHL